MKLNGLEKYFKKDKNGEIIDFKQINKHGWTPLMHVFLKNKYQNFNLNEEQWDYIIKNSDLKQVDKYGKSPLMFALSNDKLNDLNLDNEQLDYLIKNSDLKQSDNEGFSPLIWLLAFNYSENLNLSNEQWKYMITNSDLSIITEKKQLIELKKIQSELINDEISYKINTKVETKKVIKI